MTPSEIIPEVLNVEGWAEIRRLHRSEGMRLLSAPLRLTAKDVAKLEAVVSETDRSG